MLRKKNCSRKIFQKISQKIEDITFTLEFRVFLDIFEIFTEDCFLMRSIRRLSPLGFYPYRAHAKGVVLCEGACFCLLSAFYNTPPSENPSKNPCPYWNPYKVPSKNPSKKALPLKNLLRTLLRSVRLHDPLGVRPTLSRSQRILVRNYRSQKVPFGGTRMTQK